MLLNIRPRPGKCRAAAARHTGCCTVLASVRLRTLTAAKDWPYNRDAIAPAPRWRRPFASIAGSIRVSDATIRSLRRARWCRVSNMELVAPLDIHGARRGIFFARRFPLEGFDHRAQRVGRRGGGCRRGAIRRRGFASRDGNDGGRRRACRGNPALASKSALRASPGTSIPAQSPGNAAPCAAAP
jgi:hypothetical protein